MAEKSDKTALLASSVIPNPAGPVPLVLGALGGAFGAGSTSPNIGGQQANMNTLFAQAKDLRQQALDGKIDQPTYEQNILPILQNAQSLYSQVARMGQKPANNIRPLFYQFANEGFIENTGGDNWVPVTQPDPLGGTPYGKSSSVQDILNSYKGAGKPLANAAKDIKSYGTTFQQMFASMVGRDPTEEEFNQFFSNVVKNDTPWSKSLDQTQLRQETSGLLSQFYTRTAQEEAQKRAEATSTAAVAPGSAFDVWSNSYRNSINDVSTALQDYQSRLFEKLRPQLLTSLKAQGLLDTGALNTAFAGAAKDLGESSSNYLAQAKTGIEQDIAQQKYGLMSAPTQFKLSNAFNTVPQLTQFGQTALQNVYGNLTNQNMFNQQAALQRDLANQQYANQPSLLSQYGGMILGGAAGGLAQKYSDSRLKENIKKSNHGLDDVIGMGVVEYKYQTSGDNHIGLIAQELKEIVPEAVKEHNGYLLIDYNEIVPILIKSIQDLNRKVEALHG